MRLSLTLIALAILGGCAAPVVTPRAYLDEETAATITAVAKPWIFTAEESDFTAKDRDSLSLFAIDVNRMGDHRQYLAVLVSAPPRNSSSAAVTLELQGGAKSVSLQPATDEPRRLGIAKPLAPSYTLTARWLYFPVSKEILATVMRSSDLRAALVAGDKRIVYSMWRDGSAEIAELTSALP